MTKEIIGENHPELPELTKREKFSVYGKRALGLAGVVAGSTLIGHSLFTIAETYVGESNPEEARRMVFALPEFVVGVYLTGQSFITFLDNKPSYAREQKATRESL